MDFFERNSAQIEIIRDKKLEPIFFILLPIIYQLGEPTKIEFNEGVDRSSTKTKINSLHYETKKTFLNSMRHNYRIRGKLGKLVDSQWLYKFSFEIFVRDLSFYTALVINFIILSSFFLFYYETLSSGENERIFYGQSDDGRLDNPSFMDKLAISKTIVLLDVFGCVMVILTFLYSSSKLIQVVPLLCHDIWSSKKKVQRTFLTKVLFSFFKVIESSEVLFYILYFVFALLGVLVHWFFFSFHLVIILSIYTTLRNVTKAITQPKLELFLTFMLFLIIEYAYSIIGMLLFDVDYGEDVCTNPLRCFVYTFDFTFKYGGGVGGYLDTRRKFSEMTNSEDSSAVTIPFMDFLFDNSFNLFLVIIMIQITAGIIIDTFCFLREEENKKNLDMRNFCFICGIKRDTFEKQRRPFDLHIHEDHNMWNYVYYLAYLTEKNQTDYTGNETFVYSSYVKNNTKWFPLGRAICMKGQDAVDDYEQVDNLKNSLTKVQIALMDDSDGLGV